jgi:uncharacterized protein (DUF736 family)
MSQQYDGDTNRGALFKNTQRATDRQPEYKGAINVGGTDYWISAWIKTSKAGDRYMSLSVTAKDVPGREAAARAAHAGRGRHGRHPVLTVA